MWEFLEVKTAFKDWITWRIKEYGFIEKSDFTTVILKTEDNPKGGPPSKEYHITIDVAKELSMVEKTPRGKQARQYFIECEKSLSGHNVCVEVGR
jgi:anti-repressor protein